MGCSSLAFVAPLVFVGVLLLFTVLMHSYFVYSSFSPIGVLGTVSLVINLQVLVDPRLRWLLLMVQSGPWYQSSWRSLSVPGALSGLLGVAMLFWWPFGSASTEVVGLGLVLRRWLACSWSCGGQWPWLTPLEVSVSSLSWLNFLAQVCSHGGRWLGPGPFPRMTWVESNPTTVSGLGLLP